MPNIIINIYYIYIYTCNCFHSFHNKEHLAHGYVGWHFWLCWVCWVTLFLCVSWQRGRAPKRWIKFFKSSLDSFIHMYFYFFGGIYIYIYIYIFILLNKNYILFLRLNIRRPCIHRHKIYLLRLAVLNMSKLYISSIYDRAVIVNYRLQTTTIWNTKPFFTSSSRY